MTMIDFNVPWTDSKDSLALINAIKRRGWTGVGCNVYCQLDKGGLSDIAVKLPSVDIEGNASYTDQVASITTTVGQPSPLSATFIRRITIILHDGFQPNSVNKLADSREYDVVAVMPTTQKTFQAACENVNCDLINLDYYCHCIPFKIKRGMVMAAFHRGCFFEVTMSRLEHLDGFGFEGNGVEKAFRAHLSSILRYIPLKRLILSPGHTKVSQIVDPLTFVGMCNELLSNAIAVRCDTRDCVTVAPRGCISKGGARRTYGTGIIVHEQGESMGKTFSTFTST